MIIQKLNFKKMKNQIQNLIKSDERKLFIGIRNFIYFSLLSLLGGIFYYWFYVHPEIKIQIFSGL